MATEIYRKKSTTEWNTPDLNGAATHPGLQGGAYTAPSEQDWDQARRRDDGSLRLTQNGKAERELLFERFTPEGNEARPHIDAMQRAFAERVHLVMNPVQPAGDENGAPEVQEALEEETVLVFGGWGESSELMEKGIGVELREANPNAKIIYVNLNGRGTEAYADSNRASTLGLEDYLKDAEAFALRNKDLFKGKVTCVGHSMGYMAASKVAAVLEKAESTKVKKVVGLMPALPAISPLVSWSNFWEYTKNTLRAQLDPMGFISRVTGWSYRQSEEVYKDLMLSGIENAGNAPYVLPDSIRLLVEWMASFKETGKIITHKAPTVIVSAQKERLLPKKMGIEEWERLNSCGVEARYVQGWDLSHSFPVNRGGMGQQGDCRPVFRDAFGSQRPQDLSQEAHGVSFESSRPQIDLSRVHFTTEA